MTLRQFRMRGIAFDGIESDLQLDDPMHPTAQLQSASTHGAKPVRKKKVRSNSTSSVFASETILHSDEKRTLYYIAYILQADIFEEAADGFHINAGTHAGLNISPTLPPEFGGVISAQDIPLEVIVNETASDPELRKYIQAGAVPTVDTIFRFLRWIFETSEVSPSCNLVAFLYMKRLKPACIFTTHNWRGLWVGCIILAQKLYDDHYLLTSNFAAVLPGVTKMQLKALEFKVFTLLNFNTYVKASVYIQAYYNLRALFKTVLSEIGPASRPIKTDSVLADGTGATRALLRKMRSRSFEDDTLLSQALFVLS